MEKRVCLLLTPSELTFRTELIGRALPLSLGVLSGHLRQAGCAVDLTDLGISMAVNYQDHASQQQFAPVFDLDAVILYLKTGRGEGIKNGCIAALQGIDLTPYDAVGLSVGGDFSFLQINLGAALARFIQDEFGKPVFVGGNNVSFMYIFRDIFQPLWQALTDAGVLVVTGPGEQAIEQFVSRGLDRRGMWAVAGVVNDRDGQIIGNPEFSPQVVRPDWDGLNLEPYYRCLSENDPLAARVQIYKWLVMTARSATHMLNAYNLLSGKPYQKRQVIPYVFNYNCPYACAYCTQSDPERGKVVFGQVPQVLDDIEHLMQQYHTNYFYFLDNYFNISPRFVDEFCTEVNRRGLKFHWSDCARFNGLSYDILARMKEAGCVKLSFGLDTASPRMMKILDRRHTPEQGAQVLKWCHELGIWADLDVIVGFPHETDEDFRATHDFVAENRPYINYMTINYYFVVPNSLMGRYPERYGIELERDPAVLRPLMSRAHERFASGSYTFPNQNFALYKFHEIGGRRYDEIAAVAVQRVDAMNRLQNPEFDEAARFYQMLLGRIRSAAAPA